VVQGNGGRNENRSEGFDLGGWAMGVFDNETAGVIYQTYQSADAFLCLARSSPRPCRFPDIGAPTQGCAAEERGRLRGVIFRAALVFA